MKKCIIIAALAPENIQKYVTIHQDDLVVCADAGYEAASCQDIVPHAVIGDFDSISPCFMENLLDKTEVMVFPHRKDETDAFLCYQYGKSKGYTAFLLFGGIGGRADHTFGNMQIMIHALNQGDQFSIYTERNEMRAYLPGNWEIERKEDWNLSVFSYAPVSTGIYLSGVSYPIENGTLTWDFPLGVSNKWVNETASLTFESGLLMVILSKGD